MPNPDEAVFEVRMDELQKYELDLRIERRSMEQEKHRLNYEWEEIKKVGSWGRSIQLGAYRGMQEYYKTGTHPHPNVQKKLDRIKEINVRLEDNKELIDVKAKRVGLIETYNAEQMAKIESNFANQQAVFKQKILKAKHKGEHPERTGTIRSPARRTSRGTVKRRTPIMRRKSR